MSIGFFLRANALRNPERIAVVYGDVRLTRKELNERTNRLADGLIKLGLKKGDRVAILAQNSHCYVEVLYALAKAALPIVPINYQLTPAEINYLVEDAEPRVLIIDQRYREIAADLRKRSKSLQTVIEIGDGSCGDVDYEALLSSSDPSEPDVDVRPDDLRGVTYTSGTTALPKGCLVTYGQLVASLSNFLIEIPVPRDAPSLMAAPMFTGAGAYMCHAAAYVGSPMVVMQRFEPEAALKLIERERIAHLFGVPTMLTALANLQLTLGCDLSSMRLVGYGGAAMTPVHIEKAMQVFGCDFYQVFGANEAGGFISFLTQDDHRPGDDEKKRKRLWSVGRAGLYADLRVVDESGRDAGPDTAGEFVIKSPSNFLGYLNKPGETVEALKDGWLYTGEIARIDADGYVYIIDRKKDMIRTGGMSVAPAEVEAVLHQHPSVLQAAVIGVPDDHFGEAVKAVVRLRPGTEARADELIAFVRERLAGYKTPKSVEFAETLPVSAAGKILKRELRASYWRERTRTRSEAISSGQQ